MFLSSHSSFTNQHVENQKISLKNQVVWQYETKPNKRKKKSTIKLWIRDWLYTSLKLKKRQVLWDNDGQPIEGNNT